MNPEDERQRIRIEERECIGRDLHDTVCQELAGANMLLCVLEGCLRARSEADAEAAARIADCVRGAMSFLRRIARGLSAVEIAAEALSDALSELCEETGRIYAIQCRFRKPKAVPPLSHEAAAHLYCMTREALSNAVRHGGASQISARLCVGSGCGFLCISDNGKGASDPGEKLQGTGLGIMRYRARQLGGRLRVSGNRRGGTRVVCAFSTGRSSQPTPEDRPAFRANADVVVQSGERGVTCV